MKQKNYFILTILLSISNCYIVFPFKTSYLNEPREFKKIKEVKDYWTYYNYYTDLFIGMPPQKMMLFISSEFYYFSIINKLYINTLDSDYIPEESNTCIREDNITEYLLKDRIKCYLVQDTLHLLTIEGQINDIYSDNIIRQIDGKKYKSYSNITFFYSPVDNGGIKTAGEIGLSRPSDDINIPDINLFKQLKEKKYIKSLVWSMIFNEDSFDEGLIVLGSLPHEYDSQNYFPEQYFTYSLENETDSSLWKINITNPFIEKEIAYYNDTINIKVNSISSIILDPNLHLIHMPLEMLDNINYLYFNNLYSRKICNYIYDSKNKNYIIFCLKKKFTEKIKSGFPSFLFTIKEFDETFEIDYENLFQEKGDLIFLLVVFEEKLDSYIKLGHLFLQDYLFTFDPDKKEIGYYKTDSLKNKRTFKRLKNFFNLKNIIILLLIIIVIICLLFFLDKRKRKYYKKHESEKDLNDIEKELDEREIEERIKTGSSE